MNLVHYPTKVTDGHYSPSNLYAYIVHSIRYTTARGTLISGTVHIPYSWTVLHGSNVQLDWPWIAEWAYAGIFAVAV